MQERSGRNLGWLCLLLLAGCGESDAPQAPAPAIKAIATKSGIEMVLIPAGEFVMGDEAGADDERPAHKVQLSAFYIDRHEVTQQAYAALMGKNPAEASKEGKADKFAGPDKPVVRVSWLFATRFCTNRSLREGLTPCYKETPEGVECDFAADGYRLPTEAEWEYACRAGATASYCFGGNAAKLADFAWFAANAGGATHPVGRKQANAWGLFDMHGNAAEWCHDVYAADSYASAEARNPRGPKVGEERVLRGGSWKSSADACRSAARASEAPGLADVCFGYEQYGFRCVRRAP